MTMKTTPRFLLAFLVLALFRLAGSGYGYAEAQSAAKAARFYCTPAPCVLPPTQASEGGNPVTDAPIVSSPLNPKQLLLGSVDGNCPPPSVLGFHLSRDGGSAWNRTCMPSIFTRQHVYWPSDEPSVGYDRMGSAYIAGVYFDSEGMGYGLIAIQKSSDGIHWGKPVIALRRPGDTEPYDTFLTVDAGPSQWSNSIYVSCVMGLGPGSGKDQVLVSHSSDGGAAWTQVAVDSVQKYPEEDRFTRLASRQGRNSLRNLDALSGKGRIRWRCLSDSAHDVFEVHRRWKDVVFASGDGDRRDADGVDAAQY